MRSHRTPRMRLARRLGIERNPLRRRSDWIEAWLRLAVLIALVPACILAGSAAAGLAHAAGLPAERAARHDRQVTAVLLAGAPWAGLSVSQAAVLWVPARWTAAGTSRTGMVPAVPGTPRGAKVQVWLDNAGQVVYAPLTAGSLATRMAVTGAGAAVTVGLSAWLLLSCVRLALNRRRLRTWDNAWTAVGPQWSGRHPD